MTIILGKYGNFVENRKMTKCWKNGLDSLKKIPATNCVLKKMPAPYGGLVDWYLSYLAMSSDCLGIS